jgi:hypothetical protein
MSAYRRRYWLTVLRWVRPRIRATPCASMRLSSTTRRGMRKAYTGRRTCPTRVSTFPSDPGCSLLRRTNRRRPRRCANTSGVRPRPNGRSGRCKRTPPPSGSGRAQSSKSSVRPLASEHADRGFVASNLVLDELLGRLAELVADKLAARIHASSSEGDDRWLDTRRAAESWHPPRQRSQLAAERALPAEREAAGCKLYFRRRNLDP